MLTVSIILPTYNEAGNIVYLIEKIQKQLRNYSLEIIVVDDNSPDGTASRVLERYQKSPIVRLFVRRKDRGLAKAISFGLKRTKGEYIVVMDTDFNHNPSVLPKMVGLLNRFDLVIGSRYIQGGGMEDHLRFIMSFFYNLIIKTVLRIETMDNLSGFFAINRYKLQQIPQGKIFFGYGEYFIRLLFFAHRNDFSIKEVPVFYENRTWGQSKSKFLSMFIDYTKTAVSLLR